MKEVALITGGAKSGKSSYAVKLAMQYEKPRIFIATAVAFDDEMRKRIENHRIERGLEFETIEEPIKLAEVLTHAEGNVCVIDCITVWINNLIYYNKLDEIEKFIEALKNPSCNTIIVSNEVGMGIVPDNKLSRQYVDTLGRINQRIASIAENVVLMASGIPLHIKKGDY